MDRNEKSLIIKGILYTRKIILQDVNIPYKLSCDIKNNKLFFCINADEFSDQSFHVVELDLESGKTVVIPGVRNGFATAVDQVSGCVYIGASNGVWEYDHDNRCVKKPSLISNVDILDMFYCDRLYFVQTSSQRLYKYDGEKGILVPSVQNYMMEHFIFDRNKNLYFMNSMGLYCLGIGSKTPVLYVDSNMNFRGAAVNKSGDPYFIADSGIYSIDKETDRLHKFVDISNGYGLAFDANDNIIYSDERTLNKLIRKR